MAQLDSIARVGRSQGASIFWGLVSAFFAAAACFYFWKNLENEKSASQLRNDVLTLQDQCDSLNAQKKKLQSDAETEKELKNREDFIRDKEAQLAAKESHLENLSQQSQNQSQQNMSQLAIVKKFDDTVRKLAKDSDTDVVVRSGRPVLRVPNSVFFALGDSTLKPEGKALLDQVAKALSGQLDNSNFELQFECFTDGEAEIQKAEPKPAKDKDKDKDPKLPPPEPPRYANIWELTSARAGVITRYLHEQTDLPFQNLLVMGRGDFQPIIPNMKEGHARNRRIEITIAPEPAPFHAPDAAKSNPLEPPPEPPAKKEKEKGN